MLFFDWEKLYLLTHGNSALILEYLDKVGGNSFILNEAVVLENPLGLTELQRANYLGLCSLRNYADYKMHGQKDLPVWMIPDWIPQSAIKECPLITITNNLIIFDKE